MVQGVERNIIQFLKLRKNVNKKCVQYIGMKLYNSISQSMKNSSKHKFNKNLKIYIIQTSSLKSYTLWPIQTKTGQASSQQFFKNFSFITI